MLRKMEEVVEQMQSGREGRKREADDFGCTRVLSSIYIPQG